MNRMVCIFLLVAATLSAEGPPANWPTQAEAQSKLDELFSKSDRVEFYRIFNAGDTLAPLLTLSSRSDIEELKPCFRILMPEETEIVDGTSVRKYRSVACGCYGQFLARLFHDDDLIASMTLHHGDMIGCREVRSDSMLEIDKTAQAPLFGRLIGLLSSGDQWRKIWETKRGEPGATDNPDDAQRLREDH